ncbi:hypothetical protein L1887_59465 [Cichorium endivia]|nr:hypothetical protein L1887_59465 [Cichorium endivia]
MPRGKKTRTRYAEKNEERETARDREQGKAMGGGRGGDDVLASVGSVARRRRRRRRSTGTWAPEGGGVGVEPTGLARVGMKRRNEGGPIPRTSTTPRRRKLASAACVSRAQRTESGAAATVCVGESDTQFLGLRAQFATPRPLPLALALPDPTTHGSARQMMGGGGTRKSRRENRTFSSIRVGRLLALRPCAWPRLHSAQPRRAKLGPWLWHLPLADRPSIRID